MKNYLSHLISICKLSVCSVKYVKWQELMDDLRGSGQSKEGQYEKLFVWIAHD